MKGVWMGEPKRWYTLDQASKWLLDKTQEEWPHDRIIQFSIEQCRPDDIVEDRQYPSYLRAIEPITQEIYASDTGITFYIDKYETVINGLVYVGNNLKETAELYKSNLKQLSETGKTEISYTFLNDKVAQAYQKLASEEKRQDELTAFAGLEPVANLFKQLGLGTPQEAFPYIVHAGIPYTIEISIESVGIREKELKKLLRRYLEMSAAGKVYPQGRPFILPKKKHNELESIVDAEALAGNEQATNNVSEKPEYQEIKGRSHPLDEVINKAIKELGSDSNKRVFVKLIAYAKQKNPEIPLTGGYGVNYVEYEKNSGEKEDYTSDALRSYLGRRRKKLKEFQENDHQMND